MRNDGPEHRRTPARGGNDAKLDRSHDLDERTAVVWGERLFSSPALAPLPHSQV